MEIYKITKGNFALENTRDPWSELKIPSAQFNFKLWNHFNQLLTFGNPDCTTNCCESINSELNKDCPALRTPNSVFNKILKHKRGFLNKYAWVVELNHLSVVRRPKK